MAKVLLKQNLYEYYNEIMLTSTLILSILISSRTNDLFDVTEFDTEEQM